MVINTILINIAKEYLAFSQEKNKYDQIRFINETGMEKVRINFNKGNPSIIPEANLQSKKDRYYFKETMALLPNEFFISPFDLNIENKKVEKPLKPMIRFAVPIFNNANKKQGIVILNYLGEQLIEPMEKRDSLSPGNLMLINSDGYWLHGPDKDLEWGFMFENKKNYKFSLKFPKSWEIIQSSDVCQFSNTKGLFTSTTVYPLKEELKSNSNKISSTNPKNIKADKYYWKVISHVPAHRLQLENRGLLTKLLFLSILLFLLAAIPSWVIARLMTKRKQLQLKLYHSANYDKLTNLPNRGMFINRLEQAVKESKRYQRKFALFFIDLDGFKSVNDTLGHNAGDKLLIQVSERLIKSARESDTIARLGGDEFTIIFPTIISSEHAKTGALKIIKTLSSPFDIDGEEVQIGASIGVSIYPDNGKDMETLIKKADDAMYLAKKEGKNDYRLSTA